MRTQQSSFQKYGQILPEHDHVSNWWDPFPTPQRHRLSHCTTPPNALGPGKVHGQGDPLGRCVSGRRVIVEYLCTHQGTPLPTAPACTDAPSTLCELVTTALLLCRNTEQMWQEMDETKECIQAFETSVQPLAHVHHEYPQ